MKILTPIITLCICFFLSTPVSANTVIPPITGYTTEGIYYEAVTLELSSHTTNRTIYAMDITKEFTYSGTITPSNTIAWTEEIDGDTYSGTLYLQSYYHFNGKTVATYKGTIYLQD